MEPLSIHKDDVTTLCVCLHMAVSKWWKGMSLQHLQDSHGQKCKMVEKETNVKDGGVELQCE
jgi:hypothetical protein